MWSLKVSFFVAELNYLAEYQSIVLGDERRDSHAELECLHGSDAEVKHTNQVQFKQRILQH